MVRLVFVESDVQQAARSAGLAHALGYDAHAVVERMQMVRSVAEYEPDVVFCDLSMPDTEGIAFGKAMRSEAALRETYLVALVPYESETYRALARLAGYDGCCSRPVTSECIEAVVANAMHALGSRTTCRT